MEEAQKPTDAQALDIIAAGVARLLEKIEGEDTSEKVRVDSMQMLREILDSHGKLLKSTLSPENRLHPDISSYNPLGERDHPRPPLKRPVFVLGVPVLAVQCTLDEINALNWFTVSLEIPARKWRAVILHDGQGGELLYISKPYRNFDDTREFSAVGGILGICRVFQAEGHRPQNQDHLFDRIAQLEEQIRLLQSGPIVVPGAAPSAPAETPVVAA
jgi:hypothetical protein